LNVIKTLEDPVRMYLLLKTLEETRYKHGFEDGVRVATSGEYESVRKRQIGLMKKFLELYEENVLPVINSILKTFQQFYSPYSPAEQQQQSSIKIKFKE